MPESNLSLFDAIPDSFAPPRWRRLGLVAGVLASATVLLPHTAAAFGFEDVAARAAELAKQPYRDTQEPLPAELRQLSYDDYRDIRFRPDHALWRSNGSPFELMFFHRGKFATDAVQLNQIVNGQATPIAFDPSDYDYGHNKLHPATWGRLGHAGFRVHYALNNPAYKDELVVFLGASYFRALGARQHYGLSARALAIDTVGAPTGRAEEFPRFTAFWIERPAAQADALRIHALLESPRSTGAFEFVFRPGSTTAVDVHGQVYWRAPKCTIRTGWRWPTATANGCGDR
jgi:glucans biosynthesis protein